MSASFETCIRGHNNLELFSPSLQLKRSVTIRNKNCLHYLPNELTSDLGPLKKTSQILATLA